MFGNRPYYKWLVITLILSVVISVVFIVLYNLNVFQATPFGDKFDFNSGMDYSRRTCCTRHSPSHRYNLSEEVSRHEEFSNNHRQNTPGIHNQRFQVETKQLLVGQSCFVEFVQKIAKAYQLLDSPMKSEEICVNWLQTVEDIFSQSFEFAYKDEQVILLILKLTDHKPLELLDYWRNKIAGAISLELVETLKNSESSRKNLRTLLRTLLAVTFEIRSEILPHSTSEDLRKAHDYVFQRYVRGQKDTELIEDKAYAELLKVLASPLAEAALSTALGLKASKFANFIKTKPEKGALIAKLDRKLDKATGIPLLLVILSFLDEPIAQNLTTVVFMSTEDDHYELFHHMVYRLTRFVHALDRKEYNSMSGADVAFILEDWKKPNGYLRVLVNNFFEDLPKYRPVLEELMGVRQARDTMLMILKWSGLDFAVSLEELRLMSPLEVLGAVAVVIETLETKFALPLSVFYKALYRACIPK